MRIRIATCRRYVTLLLILTMTVIGSPLSASADDFENLKPWTTVGSAGTVDEASLSNVAMSGPFVGIRDTAEVPSTVTVRYNVTAVDGLLIGAGHCFEGRWRDNGNGGQVILTLKRFNFTTGTITTLDVLNSNNSEQSNGLSGGGLCSISEPSTTPFFNFNRFAYFVEARIIRTSANGTPALASIKISSSE
jgi:hypothetical protein